MKNGTSNISGWILGTALIIIVGALLVYVGKISVEGIRQARKQYYADIENMKKKDIEITIIEGWRREQIAVELQEKGIISSAEDFMTATESLEGYLFPDTYRYFPDSSVEDVLKKLSDNFQQKTEHLEAIDGSILTLASIVEREAKSDDERAKIAGVYKNRLDIDMKLEADPTAQYARDSAAMVSRGVLQYAPTFWDKITKDEIDSADSPYNTYQNSGLPPGPICNPGLKSIEATIGPEDHDFLYFFHSEDGQTIFSRTLEDHNYNISIYGVNR